MVFLTTHRHFIWPIYFSTFIISCLFFFLLFGSSLYNCHFFFISKYIHTLHKTTSAYVIFFPWIFSWFGIVLCHLKEWTQDKFYISSRNIKNSRLFLCDAGVYNNCLSCSLYKVKVNINQQWLKLIPVFVQKWCPNLFFGW